MANGRGVTLDLWQRQAVLAAATFLRERFGPSGDTSAKTVHDALLEVVDPTRRAVRLQREMSKSLSDGGAGRGERHMVRERRATGDRRQENRGAPMGVERRRKGRRSRDARAPLA
ncbi:MAG: hypothetical protein AB7O28_13665 [Vicinamibacterales bacterium]